MKSSIICDQWVFLMEKLNVGAFTIDTSRRITSINQTALTLLGETEAAVIQKDCRGIFRQVPCHVECPFRSRRSRPAPDSEIDILDAQARLHRVTRISTPLYSREGRMIGCLTVLQDHTSFADLIHKVDYDERTLKIILDNLDIGVLTINRGGYITFFNTAAELITGYGRRDLIGNPWNVLLGEEDARSPWTSDRAARNSRNLEINTHQGEKIPVRAEYMPLMNEQGEFIGGLLTFQDMTLVYQLDQVIHNRYSFHQMIGKSQAMQKIFGMVNVVAPTDATLLIEGATGTGKDFLARVIHSASRRSQEPFVKVNCASLPDNLLESELFGYARGAFTGADQDKPGRFQEADGGTILLDEIGDLPLSLQGKLLRVIEEKEFYPLGSRRTVKVDVRIISATNRSLESLMARQLFREDLFYRLNVLRIELPPLKARLEDLPLLVRSFLRRSAVCQEKGIRNISQEAMTLLMNYEFPGNVRELENILEHASILCREKAVEPDHLPLFVRQSRPEAAGTAAAAIQSQRDEAEREEILKALRRFNWQKSKTARALGMDRTTLWRKMKRLSLP